MSKSQRFCIVAGYERRVFCVSVYMILLKVFLAIVVIVVVIIIIAVVAFDSV